MTESDNGRNGVVFAPIMEPRIKSVLRKAVQDFLVASKAYEHAVTSQFGMKTVLYCSCFNVIFLKSLFQARTFRPDINEIAQISGEIVQPKLTEISGSKRFVSVKVTLGDVKENLQLDENELDDHLWMLMLFALYIEFVNERPASLSTLHPGLQLWILFLNFNLMD